MLLEVSQKELSSLNLVFWGNAQCCPFFHLHNQHYKTSLCFRVISFFILLWYPCFNLRILSAQLQSSWSTVLILCSLPCKESCPQTEGSGCGHSGQDILPSLLKLFRNLLLTHLSVAKRWFRRDMELNEMNARSATTSSFLE